LFLLVLLSFLALFVTYTRYYVAEDYLVSKTVACDPAVESCFVGECDSETDETCPTDESERTDFYKVVMKPANLIPRCDPEGAECDAMRCAEGMGCEEILCDPEHAPEGERCSGPEDIAEPSADDGAYCADGTECYEADATEPTTADEGGILSSEGEPRE